MPPPAPITVPLNISAPVTFGLLSGVPLTISVRQAVLVAANTGYGGAFPLPTLANSAIVVCVNAFNVTNGDVPAITGVTLGGAAGNFAQAGAANSTYAVATQYIFAGIWVAYGVPAGQTTVVVNGNNLSLNADYGTVIYEVVGVTSNASPLDRAAAAGATAAGTAWSSGNTAATRSASEIWFGTASGAGVLTLPNWISQQNDNLAASYQIVSAESVAAYAGTQGSSSAWAAVVATLTAGFASGGTAQIGPRNQREVWYPQVVSVSASTDISQATCSVYAGPDTSQPNFVWSTPNGSSGDSTANVSGPGLTAANLPGRAINCNEYVFAIWSGGDFGAQGRLNIQGTKVIGSGGPPGWTHTRVRV